jgi:hypothetical protein
LLSCVLLLWTVVSEEEEEASWLKQRMGRFGGGDWLEV